MSALLDLPVETAPDDGHEFLERLRRRAFDCHEQGALAAAESAYQRILERYPADLEVRRALGALALQTGKFRWALQLFSQVAEFEDTADVQAQIGLALCGLSRFAEALRCYDRAIAAQFDHLPARLYRAQVLHALGRGEAAAHAFKRASELGCEHAMAHTLHGITLGDLGSSDAEARARLDVEVADPAKAAPASKAERASPSVRTTAMHHRDWTGHWKGLLNNAAPTAAILLLSVLLGSELARAAISLLAREPPAPFPTLAPARASALPLDAESIVNAHLFGEVLQIQDPAQATPSKADLQLTGTLATANPRSGIAIIRAQGKSHAYSVGESLDGATLWQVYKDHVILERAGSFESLLLPLHVDHQPVQEQD